jgi:hypothetical protein
VLIVAGSIKRLHPPPKALREMRFYCFMQL